MKRRRAAPKLSRSQLAITPELQVFAEEHYPIPKGAKIEQGFSWCDGRGTRRRFRLFFDDGLQLDATFGAPRGGAQTVGRFSMKWHLHMRKEPA